MRFLLSCFAVFVFQVVPFAAIAAIPAPSDGNSWETGSTCTMQHAFKPAGKTTNAGTCAVDLQWEKKLDDGRFILFLEAGTGSGLPIERISNFNGAVVDHPGLLHSEGWYEHAWADGHAVLRMGKIDVTRWLDNNALANDERSQFLSGVFVNNLAVPWPQEHGPAVALQGALSKSWRLAAAATDARGVWDAQLLPLGLVETCAALSGKHVQGALRALAWARSENPDETQSGSDGGRFSWGFGVSADVLTQDWGLFGRFGKTQSDILPVSRSLSAGMRFGGRLFGRSHDEFAAAVGITFLREPAPGAARETHGEIYYTLRLTEHLFLTLDIQGNILHFDDPVGGQRCTLAAGMRLRGLF